MPEDLRDILLTDRGRLRPVPEEFSRDYYGRTYGALVEFLKAQGLPDAPELYVAGSPYALTEMLRTPSGTWIVYDQFLGQVFARLSALVDQGAGLASIDAYLTKLYADRLLVAGRAREALLVALVHQMLRMQDGFRGTPDRARLASVHVQETFTLAHELTHFALSTSAEFKRFWYRYYFSMVSVAEENLEEEVGSDAKQRLAETLADDYNREYVRRYGDQDPKMLADGRARLVEHYLQESSDEFEYRVQLLEDDPVLTEEAVCDAVASVLTAQLLGDRDTQTVREVLVSCLRASQHLRLIKTMDAKIGLADMDYGQAVFATTMRGHCLRLFFRALFESDGSAALLGTPPGEASEEVQLRGLLSDLRLVNITFYERVFDAVLTGSFYDRFEAVDDDGRKVLDSTLDELPDENTSWARAVEILGF